MEKLINIKKIGDSDSKAIMVTVDKARSMEDTEDISYLVEYRNKKWTHLDKIYPRHI